MGLLRIDHSVSDGHHLKPLTSFPKTRDQLPKVLVRPLSSQIPMSLSFVHLCKHVWSSIQWCPGLFLLPRCSSYVSYTDLCSSYEGHHCLTSNPHADPHRWHFRLTAPHSCGTPSFVCLRRPLPWVPDSQRHHHTFSTPASRPPSVSQSP